MTIKTLILELQEHVNEVVTQIQAIPYPSNGNRRDEASAHALSGVVFDSATLLPAEVLNRHLHEGVLMQVRARLDQALNILLQGDQRSAGGEAVQCLTHAWKLLSHQMVTK